MKTRMKSSISKVALPALWILSILGQTAPLVWGACVKEGGTVQVPAELAPERISRLKDGEYLIGRFQTRKGTMDLKLAVRSGTASEPYLVFRGVRLKDYVGALPAEADQCLKQRVLAADTQRMRLLDELDRLLVPRVHAASCRGMARMELWYVGSNAKYGDLYVVVGIKSDGSKVACSTLWIT